MLERLRQLFSTKQTSGLAIPQPWLRDALDLGESYSGIHITPHRALESPAVAACVRLLGESVATLPLHVFRREPSGSKTRDADAPEYPLLHDAPNDYQSSYTWRQKLVTDCILHGNHFSIIDRDLSGQVRNLWPLDATSVAIDTSTGRLIYRTFGPNGRDYEPGELLHFKPFTLDGITGVSLIHLARQAIGLDIALMQYSQALFRNGATPGLVVTTVAPTNAKTEDSWQRALKKYTGLGAGKALILPNGTKAEVLSMSPVDAEVTAQKQAVLQDIARHMRVPPHMVGDLSRSTYSNSEQEILSFAKHTLAPWLSNIEAELELKLFRDGPLFAEFDLSGLLRGDQASRYAAYAQGIQSGFLSIADVRRAENLPVEPSMEQLLRPLNLGPVSEANHGTGN